MHLTSTVRVFWAAGLIAHSLLLVVLVTRRRASIFPVFTTLISQNIASTITLYAIFNFGTKHSYLVAYFAFAILNWVLQISVIYELARHLFCSTGTWAPIVSKWSLILVIPSILIAAVLACLPVPPERTLITMLLDRGNIFSATLQCELFVGMLAFATTEGLAWRTHVARIAQGFAFFLLIGLLTDAGHSVTVRQSSLFQALTFVQMTAYLVCTSYWTVTLWMDEPTGSESIS